MFSTFLHNSTRIKKDTSIDAHLDYSYMPPPFSMDVGGRVLFPLHTWYDPAPRMQQIPDPPNNPMTHNSMYDPDGLELSFYTSPLSSWNQPSPTTPSDIAPASIREADQLGGSVSSPASFASSYHNPCLYLPPQPVEPVSVIPIEFSSPGDTFGHGWSNANFSAQLQYTNTQDTPRAATTAPAGRVGKKAKRRGRAQKMTRVFEPDLDMEMDVPAIPKSKHVCKICNRKLYRPEHLNRHMDKHTGNRPIKCYLEGCQAGQKKDGTSGRFDNGMDHLFTHLKHDLILSGAVEALRGPIVTFLHDPENKNKKPRNSAISPKEMRRLVLERDGQQARKAEKVFESLNRKAGKWMSIHIDFDSEDTPVFECAGIKSCEICKRDPCRAKKY